MSRDLEPTDRAVLLLQRTRELLLECRAVAEQLGRVPDGAESSTAAGERIAHGVLVAALEEGLVRTLQDAMGVLKRFSAPAGPLGGTSGSGDRAEPLRGRRSLTSPRRSQQ